ncbi:family 78 glycoside hydrolase catalytic domain [Naasia sp. SYSU D00057]|uniref:family 78 glycoside hydrolase catalytic domain n=1 Tax=Naasia sp. SYSU D00057 TaxID=2817380 RepID=UPI001B313AD6|nr:family 78 glycoside hydrolase catalytic domain [Naasia sp. SYSU D00057]
MTDTTPLVSRVWLEGRGGPRFLATGTPALSWQVETTTAGWRQAGARVELRRGSETESVELHAPDSQSVTWPFSALAAYDDAEVRVAVRGDGGKWSAPSAWVSARTAALGPGDWTAAFIASPEPIDESRRPIRFRTVFEARGPVRSAVLSATAHGVYETVLNGAPTTDEVLAPGWTAYDQRLLFQSSDVTALVRPGRNVLGATVAEGWYRERFGFDGKFAVAYPGPVALSAQLRLEYEDGSVDVVATDATWETSATGPTVSASIYQGETYDARAEDDAFENPDAALPGAGPAVVIDADSTRLAPSPVPPVRRIERVAVADVLTSASGKPILDFGQNLVGWLELDLDLPAGTELVLRHAEVLEHGELGLRPLRFAAATDSFTAAGDARTWSPRFTFHGFRYAQVEGLPEGFDPARITAVVVHTDLERTGWLTTSDPMLDQLHANVVWGMRGNFLSIPTDCPQRDERLGWTGDIQVFTPTASYLYDVSGFLRSWLRDLALQQTDTGVPMVIPSPLPDPPAAAAAWGDAATLVPDALFARYGDPRVLEDQYPSMRQWVETLRGLAGDDHLWTGTFQFGDWLDPAAPPHNPAAAKTDADIVATAHYFRSTQRLAEAARILGRDEDAREYAALAELIRDAWVREYVTGAGRVLSDAHTAYALAIAFDLLEGERRQAAGDRLAELVRAYGYRVRTGFVGTPLICDALTTTGHVHTAYRLLLERGNPSWLYPITMGATTIWERWDSMLPDGTINPGEMTSFNHYALGAVADWMQRTIGGIAPAEPGYRVISVHPRPGGALTSASASLETGYGRVSTDWRIEDGRFSLKLTVPVGAEALVVLPGRHEELRVGSGAHEWTVPLTIAERRPRAFSMDSALADFADDPEAKASLEEFFGEIGYFISFGWNDSGAWRSDARLGSSLIMFPREQRPRLEALLGELNAA